jgi:hypothetical protein
MRQRMAAELTTTFASSYTSAVDLAGALDPSSVAVCDRQATGKGTSSGRTFTRVGARLHPSPFAIGLCVLLGRNDQVVVGGQRDVAFT